jgi:antitoxin component of RelBE/YafQ-DinJ toxin-antitoxin module
MYTVGVRTPLLTLRLDEESKARWQAEADLRGLTLSEFVRECVEAVAGGAVPSVPIKPRTPPERGVARPEVRRVLRDVPGLDLASSFKGPDFRREKKG